jgi:hypothetical protein
MQKQIRAKSPSLIELIAIGQNSEQMYAKTINGYLT